MQKVESFEGDTVVDLQLRMDTWLKKFPRFEIVQVVNIPISGKIQIKQLVIIRF